MWRLRWRLGCVVGWRGGGSFDGAERMEGGRRREGGKGGEREGGEDGWANLTRVCVSVNRISSVEEVTKAYELAWLRPVSR